MFVHIKIPYIENPNVITDKRKHVRGNISKIPGYKINIQKSLEILTNKNDQTKKENNTACNILKTSKILKNKLNQSDERFTN